MAKEKVEHGLRPLKGYADPGQQLRDDILGKLAADAAPWKKGMVVSASKIVEETGLAPGTVRNVMQQLVREGVFRVNQGAGYTVLNRYPERLATTLVSVSEFCSEAGFECISVLDPDSCIRRPFAEFAKEVSDDALEQKRFRDLAPDLLELSPQDHVLFIRRIRGWRRKTSGEREEHSNEQLKWGILETLFLVPALVGGLEARVRSKAKLGDEDPLGNLSLHAWLSTNHVELERSEYLLSVGRLCRRDQRAWNALQPKATYRSNDVFIRLRAVTYKEGRKPILFTIENLVPGCLDLKVSGFQFGDPALNTFP